MKSSQIASFILSTVIAIGFILPIEIASAFEQFPRSLAWELVTQSGAKKFDANGDPYAIHYAQAGDTVNMQVTVRNRSRNRAAEVWYGTSALLDEGPNYPNAHAIGLGTWAPMDHIPPFLDASSFVINNNRLAYYDGPPVHRGELMYLDFQVRLAENLSDGVYDLTLSLVREFDEWGWRDNGQGQNHRYRSMLWKFVVGDASPHEGYLTYSSASQGIAFDWADSSAYGLDWTFSTEPYENGPAGTVFWSASYGVPETGNVARGVRIWDENGIRVGDAIKNDIAVESTRRGVPMEPYEVKFTVQHYNGLEWVIFKYDQEYANANVETRIATLPNGKTVEIWDWGWDQSANDVLFLESLRTV